MRPDDIIAKLEEATENRRPLIRRLIADERDRNIVAALALRPTSRHTRQILCDILGFKKARGAVAVLVTNLHDTDDGVRCSAADALGKIRDPAAGQPLFEQYQQELPASVVRGMLLSAMGASYYRPATPTLIAALEDPDSAVRLCAAWGLGELDAQEAREPLERALAKESEDFSAAYNMRTALYHMRLRRRWGPLGRLLIRLEREGGRWGTHADQLPRAI
jgi:HEAT repeat protein